MKLSARDTANYFRKPDLNGSGILIYGEDPMRVAIKRAEVVKALIGQNGEKEMRLTRHSVAELAASPGILSDTIRTIGFFSGARVALIEEANDKIYQAVEIASKEWKVGDAQIIVTAAYLRPSSKLRKLFEGHKTLRAAAVYDNPPTVEEFQQALQSAGLKNINQDSKSTLKSLSFELGPGDFQQLLNKISLFKLGDDTPLSLEDIMLCAPASTEADLNDLIGIVAEGRYTEINSQLRRLEAQGTTAVTICINTLRHFKTLYLAASDPDGPSTGLKKVTPPVFGPRQERLLRQIQNWGLVKLEIALKRITSTDLVLRSANQNAPPMALVERMLIQLAMLSQGKK
ncbi:MAG: DNA polymerase III subunit delta [Aestuariivita sp.]|nr:DNA polymerase III subunit delta [Aestuariivita sp.]